MARPKQPLIEIERAIDAAIAIIDESGIDSLTMRALGKRMNVNPASLYHHFENRDALFRAVQDRVIRDVRPTESLEDLPWDDQMRCVGRAFGAFMSQHPRASFEMTARNPAGSRLNSNILYEGLAKSLLASGFDEDGAAMVIGGFKVLMEGCLMEEAIFGAELRYGTVDALMHPFLARVADRAPRSALADLGMLIEYFIAGVKSRHAQPGDPGELF